MDKAEARGRLDLTRASGRRHALGGTQLKAQERVEASTAQDKSNIQEVKNLHVQWVMPEGVI
jgi:predicted secreted Zn-dependent protease